MSNEAHERCMAHGASPQIKMKNGKSFLRRKSQITETQKTDGWHLMALLYCPFLLHHLIFTAHNCRWCSRYHSDGAVAGGSKNAHTQGKKAKRSTFIYLICSALFLVCSFFLSVCHFVYKTARPIDDRPPQAVLWLRFHANLFTHYWLR